MKANRWRGVVVASLLMGGAMLNSGAELINLGGGSDPYTGKKRSYEVPAEIIAKLPSWDGVGDLPLELGAAMKVAREQADRDYPGKVGALKVAFLTMRGAKGGGVWAYCVGFRLQDADATLTYLVLLDGTVVSLTAARS